VVCSWLYYPTFAALASPAAEQAVAELKSFGKFARRLPIKGLRSP
jgi:hypothetical protein